MGHREQAGTEGPEQTPTAEVGDTEGWQGLEGMPLPLHSARVRQGWGEGTCRGAPGAEACHEGGEVPSRKKAQWGEVRFLTQVRGGWGGSSTLKTLDSDSLGCWDSRCLCLCL